MSVIRLVKYFVIPSVIIVVFGVLSIFVATYTFMLSSEYRSMSVSMHRNVSALCDSDFAVADVNAKLDLLCNSLIKANEDIYLIHKMFGELFLAFGVVAVVMGCVALYGYRQVRREIYHEKGVGTQ